MRMVSLDSIPTLEINGMSFEATFTDGKMVEIKRVKV